MSVLSSPARSSLRREGFANIALAAGLICLHPLFRRKLIRFTKYPEEVRRTMKGTWPWACTDAKSFCWQHW
jgi:hypothetical protein